MDMSKTNETQENKPQKKGSLEQKIKRKNEKLTKMLKSDKSRVMSSHESENFIYSQAIAFLIHSPFWLQQPPSASASASASAFLIYSPVDKNC